MHQMVSFMVVIPDDPELQEFIDCYRNFYQIVMSFKWNQKNGCVFKMQLLLDLLKYLCIQV